MGGDGGTTPPPGVRDADGDGISDDNEDRTAGVDTDGDGVADYLDDDSDGDGIPDSFEASPGGAGAIPPDTDGDGVPDFRDTDADGNGIPDGVEGAIDSDGDGILDFRDIDNDGDSVRDALEVGDDPSMPIDFDGDGLPYYLDYDSDDDTIADLHEAIPPDTDDDGFIDRHDLDSDGDGWPDSEEAGDGDPLTPPVDSDEDGTPDFRDLDSDNDGLGDSTERTLGTDPTLADTDGDGVTDLIEIAGCAMGDASCAGDPLDPESSPRTRGDFVFFEPYMEAPTPPRDTLDFSTNLQIADVYFLVDTTGSMSGAINNVRSSLSTAGGIIEQVRAEIPNVWFGIGEYRDYGDAFIYRNQQDITDSVSDAQAGANRLSASGGGDYAEGGIPAMWAVATGMGVPGAPTRTDCPAGTFGYPCWREGAVPILVMVADAPYHNGPSGNAYGGYLTYAEALPAVMAARLRVIGAAVGSGPMTDMTQIARDTGAVDGAGTPLVSSATSGTVSSGVVDQIRTLANSTPIDISLEYVDDAADSVDSFAAFVDHIEANETGDAARGCAARVGEDTDADGFADTFRDVTPGMPVCFDIVVKQNDTVMPTTEPQVFRGTLRLLGDGFTELDSRDVFFLVPPVIEGPDGPD